MRIRLLPLLLVVGLIAGCGGGDDSPEPATTPSGTRAATSEDLAGRGFVARSVDGYELVADTQISLEFGNNSLSVSAGCNSTSGKYEVKGGELQFKPGPSTLMGCPEDLLDQDKWLNDFLESRPVATTDDGDLALTGTGDVTIKLEDSTGKPAGS